MSRPSPRLGLACVELLLVLVVALVGLALALPAVAYRRRSSVRVRCSDGLRRLGFAAIQYCDERRFFPHVGGYRDLDGGTDTGDGPRALRTLVWAGCLDAPEAFVCPASSDAPRPRPMLPRRWSWGGREEGSVDRSPLAGDGVVDPPLLELDELSYGWTRRFLNSGLRSTTPLAADRACRTTASARSPLPGRVGNHADGVNVVQGDGTTVWLEGDDPDAVTLADLGRPQQNARAPGSLGIEPVSVDPALADVERERESWADAARRLGTLGLSVTPALVLAIALQVASGRRRGPRPVTIYPPAPPG